MTAPPVAAHPPERLAWLDALRGGTVLLMTLFNDLEFFKGTPAWARHAAPGGDGLTVVDLILPMFMLLLGASVPLACARPGGAPPLAVLRRTLLLLLCGVFMVNLDEASAAAMALPAGLWRLGAMAALLALLHEGRAASAVDARCWLLPGLRRALAGGCLLWLALCYRGSAEGAIVPLRVQWFGILGILGWAYLVSHVTYRLCRGEPAALVGALALLVLLHLADRAGGLAAAVWHYLLPVLGPCDPIALAGVLCGARLLPGAAAGGSPSPSPASLLTGRLRWWLPIGMGLVAAGLLLRALHPLSKSTASPSYCALSAGLCCLLLSAAAAAAHLPQPRPLAPLVRALRWLGENALLLFLLPECLYAAALLYQERWQERWPAHPIDVTPLGAWRAVAFTALVIITAWLLRRLGLRPRL